MNATWSDRYADRVRIEQSAFINEVLKLAVRPEIISFAGGLPAAQLFPRDRVVDATRRLLTSDHGFAALQYGVPEGYAPLREMVVQRSRDAGVPLSVENVIITSGSQQSLDLIGKVFINPGDRIIVEDPTYFGMFQGWQIYGATYTGVAADEFGILPEALEHALMSGPAKLIYLVTNFQNPTGVTMTYERRVEVLKLARQYGVGVIEDDPYGALRYSGDPVPSLMALDTQGVSQSNGNNGLSDSIVISLGSFSKTMCPGFRVAWIAAPIEVINCMTATKENSDLHTSTFAQAVLYETARDGFIDEHIVSLRSAYQERRDLMLAMMEETFPNGVTWTNPEGGMFVWVRLPDGYDSTDLLKAAIKQGVAFVPGAPFYVNGDVRNTFRLNFSNANLESIEEGMRRLAGVFSEIWKGREVTQ